MTEPTTPPADKTFTQADVEAAAARALSDGKRQGKAAQEQAIKDALGVSLDEAKTILQQSKDAETARLSEAERREKAAADREAAAQARETAAVKRERDALVRAELIAAGAGAGIQDENERREIIADAAKLVSIGDDADEAAIREAVGKVKGRHAGMFGASSNPSLPNTPPVTNPTTPTPGPKSLMEIAKREFPEFVNAS